VAGGAVAGGEVAGGEVAGGAVAGIVAAEPDPPPDGAGATAGAAGFVALGEAAVVGGVEPEAVRTNQVPSTP
jgi:hypothetical protein